jgi:hypothetical protein
MLLAMNQLHSQGMPNLKPDAFTYTAVIDVSSNWNMIEMISRASESDAFSQYHLGNLTGMGQEVSDQLAAFSE